MITQDTVLILGAGASMAYGFPSGQKLKSLIWQKLENCRDVIPIAFGADIATLAQREAFDVFVENFRENLLLSPDYSIDSFLEHHNDDYKKLGKIGIASVLLPLERKRYLYDDWMLSFTTENFSSIIRPKDGHWYQYLFNQICKHCKFEEFSCNKISVITFNYDRSLEYYLLNCLRAKYKKSLPECAEVLKKIPILHVYGKLGNLPELSDSDSIKYDTPEGVPSDSLETAERSIKIIHVPNTNTSPEFLDAQKLIIKAKRIYFLGFGYLGENMRRLFTDYSASSVKEFGLLEGVEDKFSGAGRKCYGTILGVSPHHKDWLAQKGLTNLSYDLTLRDQIPNAYNFKDSTIYDFLFYNNNARFD
jgi:hypothetical protein